MSPQSSRDRIEALIESAKTALDLTVMYVTDPSVLAKLKALGDAGIEVRFREIGVIVTDPAAVDRIRAQVGKDWAAGKAP